MLLREQILEQNDIKIEKVFVEEWGDSVFIKVMTTKERDAFENSLDVDSPDKEKSLKAKLAVRCICDDKGNTLFNDKDIPALEAKSGIALNVIASFASKLNKLRRVDIEELIKNLQNSQLKDSSLD